MMPPAVRTLIGRTVYTTLAVAGLAAASSAVLATEPARTAAEARAARVATQLAANPEALPSLADWSTGLKPFDARVNPDAVGEDGHVWAGARQSLAAWRASPAGQARQQAAAAMLAKTPGLRIDDDDLFGTTGWVASTQALLTAPAAEVGPVDVVAGFVHDHAALFEINALEIPAARVAREYITRHNGVTHLTFQQQHAGVDLHGCEVRANVTRDGRLINIASTMLPRTAAGFTVTEFKLDAGRAVIAAARHAGITLQQTPVEAQPAAGITHKTTWKTPPELRPDEPVVSERVYFPMSREDIRAAYRVSVPVRGVGHCYDVIVDAGDGSLLWRQNRLVFDTTQPVTMRVFTGDSPAPMTPGPMTPSPTQAPFVERELVTMRPEDVRDFSPNGWIDDNNTETIGNNVAAHLDLDGNNIADVPRPSGGSMRVFDFPFDPTVPPSSYRQAAVTQMFYLSNRFHDELYALGFDEVASNFQTNNFGRGGSLTPDAIQADVHDGDGLGGNVNNANFSTQGADGSSARVQMYLFNGANPDRDGALDASIVYHELAHGLSIRLVGSMFNLQSRGMGEGWSDYFGLALLAAPTHDMAGTYVTGGYTTLQLGTPLYMTNYYFGIRRFPYSLNMALNPLTFADIDPSQYSVPASVPRSPLINTAISPDASAVHNQGEVWCSALMDARALMWAREGFAANRKLMQIVVDGLKLAPANPTFLQARDAILQADLVNNAGANQTPLWTAFARRGMGTGATSPGSSTTRGVGEDFRTPFFATFTYPQGRPERLSPGVSASLRVQIAPTGLTLMPETARLQYRINNGGEIEAALEPTDTPNEYVATIPAVPCLTVVRYRIAIETSTIPQVDPPNDWYAVQALTQTQDQLFDDFEQDTGWTVGPNTATGGIWVRVDPNGAASQPEDDFSPAPGVTCWVTGNAPAGSPNGSADIDSGLTTLTSPIFDLSGFADAEFSYARWYSTGLGVNPYSDTLRVDVSVDGGATWTNAETVGPWQSPDTMPGWRQASWSLSRVGLSPTNQVRVRVIAEDAGAASIVEAAIDDFRIRRVLCSPTCAADFNGSGGLTIQDLLDFITAYLAGDARGDFNGDGNAGVQDVFDYLAAYFAGC